MFEEIRLPLFTEQWYREIERYSPARRVPVLVDGDLTVWDSVAIIEYVLETYGGAVGWPADPRARAHARSVAAEMHAGFLGVRQELPQDLRRRCQRPPSAFSPATRAEPEMLP